MPRHKSFSVLPNLLPKSDPRYKKWRLSIKGKTPWNKGVTKFDNPSVKKISDTFKKKQIDNFYSWREKQRELGKIPDSYPPLPKGIPLACLIGLVLGDGNIGVFPRTEKLSITLGTDKPKLIKFGVQLVRKVFNKTPSIYYPKDINAVKINMYQKHISKRLGVPSGNRRYSQVGLPRWIWKSKGNLIACLKGLYEAEASLSVHPPTYTHNFAFNNLNEKLLTDVKTALQGFGLHPEVRTYAIRLRRKNEVNYFKNLIEFRQYNAGWCNGSHVALWRRRSGFKS